MSVAAKAVFFTDERKKNMSEAAKRKFISDEHKRKLKEWADNGGLGKLKSKPVIDNSNGFTYSSVTNLCKSLNLSYGVMKKKLRGDQNNDTSFSYIK